MGMGQRRKDLLGGGGGYSGRSRGRWSQHAVGDPIFLPISANWSLPRADGSMIFTDDENGSNK